MTPDVDVLWLRSISETLINTRSRLSISWQLREATQDSTFLPDAKLPSQPATFFPSTRFHREQLSATSNPLLVIRGPMPAAPEHMLPLLVTLKMVTEPE